MTRYIRLLALSGVLILLWGLFGKGLPIAQAQQSGSGSGGSDPFSSMESESGGSGDLAAAAKALTLNGFIEVERASHIGPESPVNRDAVQDNIRVRLKSSLLNDNGGGYFKLDFLEDGVTGQSTIDVREARLQYKMASWLDLSLGKQVTTWGVGDMLFINDLFPKNWVAMFSGRDMEMWKDPGKALRLTAFMGPITWDVVYHPRFTPDTTPTGCRFSVFDPNQNAIAAFPQSCGVSPGEPRTTEEENGELAMRLKTRLGGFELALYSYRGYYKNPRGMVWLDTNGSPLAGMPNPAVGDFMAPFYPRLEVIGASLEGQLGPGIFTMETGRYDSLEDPNGDNFLIENSMNKHLVGYRMDFSAHFGAGIQTYMEDMQDYEAYEAAFLASNPAGYDFRKEKQRNTYTLRMTFKAQQETLWINYFGYIRPQDKDSFHKLDFTKRLDDNFALAGGVNLFDGDENLSDREFAMVREDDNAFLRLQYNF